jgi:hypothetical protein
LSKDVLPSKDWFSETKLEFTLWRVPKFLFTEGNEGNEVGTPQSGVLNDRKPPALFPLFASVLSFRFGLEQAEA